MIQYTNQAFISPCIAKKMEIEDPNNYGYVSYNATFRHLVDYVEQHNLYGNPCQDEIEYGPGSIYPIPGFRRKPLSRD